MPIPTKYLLSPKNIAFTLMLRLYISFYYEAKKRFPIIIGNLCFLFNLPVHFPLEVDDIVFYQVLLRVFENPH